MKQKFWMPGLAGVVVLVLLAGCGGKKAEHAATTREAEPAVDSGVQFAVVATESVPQARELAGTVQAASVSQVSAGSWDRRSPCTPRGGCREKEPAAGHAR